MTKTQAYLENTAPSRQFVTYKVAWAPVISNDSLGVLFQQCIAWRSALFNFPGNVSTGQKGRNNPKIVGFNLLNHCILKCDTTQQHLAMSQRGRNMYMYMNGLGQQENNQFDVLQKSNVFQLCLLQLGILQMVTGRRHTGKEKKDDTQRLVLEFCFFLLI